jgi:hypothetical protein
MTTTASPFSASLLQTLGSSHADYVQKYTKAADKALAGGYLLKADHEIAVESAKNAPVPS